MHFRTPNRPQQAVPTTLSTAELAAFITDALSRRGAPMLGTELAILVRAHYPQFRYETYGTATLKAFLERHVTGVAPVGRQGLDILYGPRRSDIPADQTIGREAAAALTLPPTNAQVWRAIASPNSTRVVTAQVNFHSGAWRVVAPATAESAEWRTVEPLSVSDQKAIAESFLSSVTDIHRRQLLAGALQNSDRWWTSFRQILLSVPDEGARYFEFRSEKIVAGLRSRLESLGLASPAVEHALRQATPMTMSRRPVSVGPTGRLGSLHSPVAENLRSLAAALVAKLPESELYDLRVRLGDVYEALRAT